MLLREKFEFHSHITKCALETYIHYADLNYMSVISYLVIAFLREEKIASCIDGNIIIWLIELALLLFVHIMEVFKIIYFLFSNFQHLW